MDFLTQLLARLFEQFKLKSPRVAALVLLALMTVAYFAEQATFLGVLQLPTWAAEGLKWVALFLLAVSGSRTTAFLPAQQRHEREVDYRMLTGPKDGK